MTDLQWLSSKMILLWVTYLGSLQELLGTSRDMKERSLAKSLADKEGRMLMARNCLLLLPHSFIVTQQSLFYQDCKSALQPGELVVTAHFSGNDTFILQDAAPGFHWKNSQATIHPFVAYYIDSGKPCHLSYT